MKWCRLAILAIVFLLPLPAKSSTVLVLQFHNSSQYFDLNWVGESVAETLMSELGGADEIVLDRVARAEGIRRLALRSDAAFAKATLIRLSQALDADYLCYGNYEVNLAPGDVELKNSTVRITSHFLDLRRMHDGPDLSETGKLSELSRLEEHLSWQTLKYLQPGGVFKVEEFLTPQKLTRVDAEESYIRGLLSPNRDQQQKWFEQALAISPQFSRAAFELGKLALVRKEYRQATTWFGKIAPADPHFAEARFKMGLSAYGASDYAAAVTIFREVSKTFPLSEVYNNLGAAENQLNQPVAIDDFRRALDGDQNDVTYIFNLGAALLKNSYFDEAAKRLQAVLDHEPDDAEARNLLQSAQQRQTTPSGSKPAPQRLKPNFDETAFRELKAMVQPKGGS